MTLGASQNRILAMYFAFIVIGALLGLTYDFFRAFRRIRHINKYLDAILISLEDIIFFVFAGSVTAIVFYVYNYSRVRYFSFVLEALGFSLYRLTVSRIVLRSLTVILRLVLAPLLILCRLVRKIIDLATEKKRIKKGARAIKRMKKEAGKGYM